MNRDVRKAISNFTLECGTGRIKCLAPTLPVSAARVDREQIARKLSGYDDATWSKLREDRKRTYRRAAESLIWQWAEFKKLFEY